MAAKTVDWTVVSSVDLTVMPTVHHLVGLKAVLMAGVMADKTAVQRAL
jgi:hypothetical protein